MTVAQIAEASCLSESTVRRLAVEGVLPRVPHTGRRIIVPRHAVEAWLTGPTNDTGRQQGSAADAPAQPTEGTRDEHHAR